MKEKREEFSEWQTKQKAPLEKELEKQKEEQRSDKEAVEQIEEEIAGRWFFIDESGCNLDMTRTHARAPKGERAIENEPPRLYGGSITMIGALSLSGMVMMTIEGGTSGEVFLQFVRRFLGRHLRAGDWVFLDNLKAHQDKRVMEEFEKLGVNVKFTPPYSPEFNPIEYAWGWLKRWMKKAKARTREELDEILAWIPDLLTRKEILSWIKCCGYLHQPP